MGNYAGGVCSGRRETCCRDDMKSFHDAKTFGKRREIIRAGKRQK